MDPLDPVRRLRRWFGWSFIFLLIVLVLLLAWAFTFTNRTSATLMDTALIFAVSALLGCSVALLGFVVTAFVARRRSD